MTFCKILILIKNFFFLILLFIEHILIEKFGEINKLVIRLSFVFDHDLYITFFFLFLILPCMIYNGTEISNETKKS